MDNKITIDTQGLFTGIISLLNQSNIDTVEASQIHRMPKVNVDGKTDTDEIIMEIRVTKMTV
jgi:hypothetical protein